MINPHTFLHQGLEIDQLDNTSSELGLTLGNE